MQQLMTDDASALGTRVDNLRYHFRTVANVFHPDPAQRASAIGQLGAVPSSAAKTAAGRLQRLAMIQFNRLANDDPRKRIAQEWMQILEEGDRLRNPAPGTPAAALSAQLAASTQAVDAHINAQTQALNTHLPDPVQGAQQPGGSGLQNNQPPDSTPSHLALVHMYYTDNRVQTNPASAARSTRSTRGS